MHPKTNSVGSQATTVGFSDAVAGIELTKNCPGSCFSVPVHNH